MKVLDPGHSYEFEDYDKKEHDLPPTLFFMKRVGPHYPGNTGESHHGTNCQEVLRGLIDRTKYLENQIHCEENAEIIRYMRYCILLFEKRAARIHGRELQAEKLPYKDNEIEKLPTCKTCGHIECQIKEHNNELHSLSKTG